MYILFKAVSSDKLGIVQVVGRILNYAVGVIPDTHVDIVEYSHLNPIVLTENVAKGWLFFNLSRDYINVRQNSLQNQQLQVAESTEPNDEKVKYYLTDEDKTNAVEFMKALMRLMLDEIYDKRFLQESLGVSNLESSTWLQQKSEAEAYTADNTSPTPLLSALASSRGITLQEMANKVNSAVNAFNAKIATMLANKQAVEKEIKACLTIIDCNKLLHNRFDITMPTAQAASEGITTGSKLDV
jgi:hypothetical protein